MKSDRKALDHQPGPVPEIRADGDSVIFCLDVSSEHARLLIRCDPDGAITALIDVDQPKDGQG